MVGRRFTGILPAVLDLRPPLPPPPLGVVLPFFLRTWRSICIQALGCHASCIISRWSALLQSHLSVVVAHVRHLLLVVVVEVVVVEVRLTHHKTAPAVSLGGS